MQTIFGVFAATAAMSWLLVPVFLKLAIRVGLVDKPDGRRKLHGNEIAVSGGVPVFVTAVIGVVLALLFQSDWPDFFQRPKDVNFIAGLGLGTLCIVLIGLIDDSRGMRGRQKLLGQIIAAGIVVGFGLRIDRLSILGNGIDLGIFAVPFTMMWLLGAINAFNLIDGVDGLATTLGIIMSIGLAIMAFMFQHQPYAVVAVALAGSLLGFLCYNFPPARIFLGDSGSMLIGLVLGALSIRASLKGPAAALVVPAVILTIPFLDVAMAILRRKLTGKSLYETDRGHLHHRLMQRGWQGRGLLLAVGSLCTLAGVGALISTWLQNEYLAMATAAIVVLILVATRSFGHTELAMLARRVHRVAVSFVPGGNPKQPQLRNHVQGNAEWDQLWDLLMDFAEEYEIDSIELNVSLPAAGEEYHGKWTKRYADAAESAWRSDIPLIVNESPSGRLRVSGAHCGFETACTRMSRLMTGLDKFEKHMIELVENASERPVPVMPSGKKEPVAQSA